MPNNSNQLHIFLIIIHQVNFRIKKNYQQNKNFLLKIVALYQINEFGIFNKKSSTDDLLIC